MDFRRAYLHDVFMKYLQVFKHEDLRINNMKKSIHLPFVKDSCLSVYQSLAVQLPIIRKIKSGEHYE